MWIAGTWNRVQRGGRALCGAVVLLAACGGGTSQIEPFVPRQMIALGDENAVLTADGKRYGINGVDANNVIDCRNNPVWTQNLIGSIGMTVDRCNPNNLTARGISRGAPGAKAADIAAQIDAQFAALPPGPKDLFLMMVGMNDIIEIYETFAGPRECDPDPKNNPPMEAAVAERGRLVARQVDRLREADTRLIVVTVHDLGLTPYGRARDAGLLTCLTAAFNARVRVDPAGGTGGDGRFWGLVLGDDLSLLMAREPGAYGLSNTSVAACAVAAPDCTTKTLVTGADSNTHLWATDRHFGPRMHSILASLADTRVRNNPF
jgi:lysophospholipase L1-like esterase